MSIIKKLLSTLILATCFNAVLCQYGGVILPALFRKSLINHYCKKYNAKIYTTRSNSLDDFFNENFWYVFKMVEYQQKDDVRLMWFVGVEGSHAIPVFYLQENGKKALLIADSLGQANFSLSCIADSKMFRALNIPIFIIQDRRQSDNYSCFLDALVWAKMITGQLSDGTYRIPDLLNFLYQNSEGISFQEASNRLFYVKKLPTTLLATVQDILFLEKYRTEDHNTYDLYITSKGAHVSFNQFLNNHKGAFALDYLRSKGIVISNHFYKYLPVKDSVFYGCNIVRNFLSQKESISRSDILFTFCVGFLFEKTLNIIGI